MTHAPFEVLLNDLVVGIGDYTEEEAWAEAQWLADAAGLDLKNAECRAFPREEVFAFVG